ncbi:retrovirus-related Pol polyprotein from transposon 412 [Trichonephila clavipes]|nr:retrovirus-related Pol polyprotein from transposon 412 [Trichonephila clavipes]
MKEGLIALNYECSKCNEQMGLYERKSAVLDGDFEWVCSTITSQNIYGRTPMIILLTMRPSRFFVKIRCHAVASTRKRSASVWLRSPLDDVCHCLPLAKIKFKTKGGEFYTKAAVKANSHPNEPYLLGNCTADLIESSEKGVHSIIAIVTQSASKVTSVEKERGAGLNGVSNFSIENTDPVLPTRGDGNEPTMKIPAFDGKKAWLAQITSADFCSEQKKCPDLRALWEKVKLVVDGKFRIVEGKLFRVTRTKRGDEIRQLCLPSKFRLEINRLSHDEIGGHLGVTKTKDRVLRYFFWSNIYKDIEEFVKSCDACQRVGKPRDKVKAPLKLVPIIAEVFSKINIDAVGPLPLSPKRNRYLITAICVTSKYLEAIPGENITSVSVIDALLLIFSRMGFPKTIQSDLGTSFTSELTTTFFDKFEIRVVHSSVSHPQSNAVERVHRTLKHVL